MWAAISESWILMWQDWMAKGLPDFSAIRYLDEFTFRFNRRTSRSRGKLFYRLLQQSVQIAPTTYHSMVGGKTQDG
jgi:hypothetical protein